MKNAITPTTREIVMQENDFIVSKTDLKGRITYANRVFMRIAGYAERELLNVQHNIIRHPDMPRGVFRLLWNVIENGQECFAYVKNLAKNGDYYWVFANVTMDYDANGKPIGYFSVRRKPSRAGIDAVGLAADRRQYPAAVRDKAREVLARVVAFLDSYVLGTEPVDAEFLPPDVRVDRAFSFEPPRRAVLRHSTRLVR